MEVEHHKEEEITNNYMQLLPVNPLSESIQSDETEPVEQEPEPEPAGPPHEAVYLVLAHLHVLELLVLSETCTSLRDAVTKDVLPWLDIQVDEPLSSRVTDETLVRAIASKAGGKMRTLALNNCSNITDDGLLTVIEMNPFISKLHLPGCYGLTSDGVIKAVKILAGRGSRLESLQIRGIHSIKKQHLEMLLQYVRTNPEKGKPEPVVYHHQYITLTCRPIDVEVCPKCGEVRMVFDCTREACNKQHQLIAACRGCKFCIARCEECGRCVGTNCDELEETLCSDALCSDCWLLLPKCNLCNRPYCRRHATRQDTNCSSSFVCEACKMISIRYPD